MKELPSKLIFMYYRPFSTFFISYVTTFTEHGPVRFELFVFGGIDRTLLERGD